MLELEKTIGYRFKNIALLETALTHSSCANESHRQDCQSYERLEFLGDSILGFVTADFLYRHEPSLPEGRMTKLRAELVCEASLCSVAQSLGIGSYMRLGRGEEHSGGRERPSILADMVEAVIAALYLDGGLDVARAFIMERVLKDVEIGEEHRSVDYKTELQELIQQQPGHSIVYELIGESGPDHNKRFQFRVSVNGEVSGEGEGRTKKEAEQMAARRALERLKS